MSLPKNNDQSKSNLGTSAKVNSLRNDNLDTNTHCSVLTGTGRSAIAVIQLQGPRAESVLSACFNAATKTRFLPGEIRFGGWRGPRHADLASESVVITPLKSSTTASRDHFEIHCHGGPAAVHRIIDDLQQAGVTLVEAMPTSTPDRLLAEAAEVLLQCTTARTAAIAMDQYRGAMTDWVERMLAQIDQAPQEAAEILRFAEVGTRLTKPFGVVLTGPPNVGKSSLLNAIVGFDRSITFDMAGTTRDVLHCETVLEGLPIRFSDTAGIRDSNEPIEKQGIARARDAAMNADLVLRVTEPGVKHEIDENLDQRAIRVLNKSDLRPVDEPWEDHLHTNAISGEGIAALMAEMVNRLAGSLPNPGSPIPLTPRQASLLQEIAAATQPEVIQAKLQSMRTP